MHTLTIKEDNKSKYVTIFFNKDDDLKKAYNDLSQLVFLGHKLPEKLLAELKLTYETKSIWNLKVFKSADTMSQSFIKSYEFIHDYLNLTAILSDKDTFYSLFDLLKLQNYDQMLSLRAEHGLV